MLESLFNKVAELKVCNFIKKRRQHLKKVCNFIKKRRQHRCFPVNIGKFLRTPFFMEHLRGLLFGIGYVQDNTSKVTEINFIRTKNVNSLEESMTRNSVS